MPFILECESRRGSTPGDSTYLFEAILNALFIETVLVKLSLRSYLLHLSLSELESVRNGWTRGKKSRRVTVM